MNTFTKCVVACGILSISVSAMALPVTGGISFSNFSEGSGFNETDVFFGSPIAPGGNAFVSSTPTGDYANYFDAGDLAMFYDFTYDPYVGTQLVWESDTSTSPSFNFQFFLEDINDIDYSANSLKLAGTGYVTDGLEQEKAIWVFTGNSASSSFSWSSSTSVPEPGTLALLGLGIGGLAAARRRQSRKVA